MVVARPLPRVPRLWLLLVQICKPVMLDASLDGVGSQANCAGTVLVVMPGESHVCGVPCQVEVCARCAEWLGGAADAGMC